MVNLPMNKDGSAKSDGNIENDEHSPMKHIQDPDMMNDFSELPMLS